MRRLFSLSRGDEQVGEAPIDWALLTAAKVPERWLVSARPAQRRIHFNPWHLSPSCRARSGKSKPAPYNGSYKKSAYGRHVA